MVTMLPVEEVAERFLEEETAHPVPGVEPAVRARFHRLVRQCAANWLLHPKATLRITRAKNSSALVFEGPMGGKPVAVFSLRAHYDTKDFRFIGPNPDRKKLGLAPASLTALDRLRDLYEAFLADKSGGDAIVTIMKSDRLPDLVPLVEETRRAMDGGQETSVPVPPIPGMMKKKPATPHAPGAEPGASPQAPPSRVAAPSAAGAAHPPHPAPAAPKAPAAGASSPKSAPPAASAAAAAAAKPPAESKPAARAEPALAYIMLASPKPKASAEFYARLLQIKPQRKTKDGDYVEFTLRGVVLAVQEDLSREERNAYGYGQVEKNRGWGALYQIRVADFDLCLRRARKLKGAIIREVPEARSFVVRDPAGYLLEIVAF